MPEGVFADVKEEDRNEDSPFRLPSTRMPPKERDAASEMYVTGVGNDVQNQTNALWRVRPRDNLLPPERQALTNLWWRWNIVIKPANKGSAVVVVSKDYFMKEEQQLSNTNYYQTQYSSYSDLLH